MHADEVLQEFKRQRPEAVSHIRSSRNEQDPSPSMQPNSSTSVKTVKLVWVSAGQHQSAFYYL